MRTEAVDRLGRLQQELERPARARLGLLYPLVLLVLGLLAVALIIDNRTRLVGSSYEIEALRERLAELRVRNRRLRVEASALTAPSGVELFAAEHGLGPAAPGQVLPLPAPAARVRDDAGGEP